MNIMERIKFWQAVRKNQAPFWYSKNNADHFAVDSYNIFTDRVHYRHGRFGECDFGPYPTMSREKYLKLGENGYYNTKDKSNGTS